jgi:hypothetical protein
MKEVLQGVIEPVNSSVFLIAPFNCLMGLTRKNLQFAFASSPAFLQFWHPDPSPGSPVQRIFLFRHRPHCDISIKKVRRFEYSLVFELLVCRNRGGKSRVNTYSYLYSTPRAIACSIPGQIRHCSLSMFRRCSRYRSHRVRYSEAEASILV